MQGSDEVLLGATTGLHDREPGSRVRNEHVHQPVAARGTRRFTHLSGDIEDALPITCPHLERRCLHEAEA